MVGGNDMSVYLTSEQQDIKERIQHLYNQALRYFEPSAEDNSSMKIDDIIREMGKLSHELHMQLEPKPKHHQYMIDNSGMNPEDPEFYYHIHSVEDLLKYLENPNANDDPEDLTLNEEFKMKIYSRRWGHDDTYTLIRNEDGWSISHLTFDGQSGKNAEPVLSYILRHDSISYPNNLADIMESIWTRAAEEGLNKTTVQEMLDQVGEWISIVERSYPKNISR